MRLASMHQFTKRLPEVEKAIWSVDIGKSTSKAMQNGAYWGMIHEIDSYIRVFSEKFENPVVIMTGGDASDLAENLKTKIFVHPELVLIGLNKILDYNVREI